MRRFYNDSYNLEMESCLIKKKEMSSGLLIEAAFELFAEHGLEKTSLGMIAKKVEMTKSSIYYHFATKEELISRTFEHMFKDHHFSTYFHLHLATRNNFAEFLFLGGMNMFPAHDQNHHSVLRVLNEFMTLAERDELYQKRITKMQQDFIHGFRQLLTMGVEWEVVPPENLEEKATLLALTIDHLSRCMMMKFDLNYQAIWKEAVNSFLYREKRLI